MYEPSPSGFDQAGLADLFKVQYDGSTAGSAPTPSPRPSGSRPNQRTAIIVGCSVGGIAGITLVIGLGLCYRRQIHHRITGSESPRQEMDNHERIVQEMDNQQNFVHEIGTENICWELPSEIKPIEMWSPTERSEESPGSGHFRRVPVPADKKVPEIPCSAASSAGSTKGSQRGCKMLPPLPIS